MKKALTDAAIKEEDITAAFLGAGARVAVVVLDRLPELSRFPIGGKGG